MIRLGRPAEDGGAAVELEGVLGFNEDLVAAFEELVHGLGHDRFCLD